MIEPVQEVEQPEVGEPEAREPRTPTRRSTRGRLLPVGAMLLVTAVFFSLTLAVSLNQLWNADTSNITLQGWDLIHGQVLLHGWWSTDVNFYTLDLPIYALSVLTFGLTDAAAHVAGSVVYTLIFLSACWLAKGRTRGGAFWLRVALVALFMTAVMFNGNDFGEFVMVPDHDGTICFFLVAFVLHDRFAGRRWTPWVMLAVLTLGQIGDVSTRYILVSSLLLVWVAELLRTRRLPTRRPRTPETWLALAAVGSVVLSYALRKAMIAMGSYYLAKARSGIAPLSQWHWHFTGMWESLFYLFGVDTSGYPGGTPGDAAARAVMIGLGAVALVCGALSMLATLIRWTKVDVADRLLFVAILVYLGAYEFSTVPQPGRGGGYEFGGVVAMSAVLSARTIGSLRPLRMPALRVAGTATAAVVAAACLLSGTALFERPWYSPLQPLGAWLQDHHLTYGLAPYWSASPITVYTGGRVSVRPIVLVRGGFKPRTWNARQQWFEASNNDANFVLTGYGAEAITAAQAERSFGKPAAVYQADHYTILVYNYNLLTKEFAQVLPPGA